MKKIILALIITAPLAILSGCTVDTVSYDDGYVSDSVYTAGYYDASPYWGNTYYTGYTGLGWNNPGVVLGSRWGGWGVGGWGHHGRGWGHRGGHHGGGRHR